MPAPAQRAISTATWNLQITDRSMTSLAFLDTPNPQCRYTRRRSGYCEMSLSIEDRDDLHALEGAIHTSVLRGWRNGTNVFNGEFTEIRETAQSWELVAKDPYYNLHWREVQVPITYTAVDSGDIAWNLIAAQHALETVHLQQGASPARGVLTRDYVQGDRISEKIETLTRLASNGFQFTIDAVDGVPGIWAEFVIHTPVARPLARFEFGTGTINNCTDYLRENVQLVNRVNVPGSTNVVSAESATSPALHGLWEETRGQVNEVSDTTLAEIAAGQIMDTPEYVITLMAGPECPQLFTDFDVGDEVPILLRRLGRTIESTRFVKEVTLVLDPHSGVEDMEALVLEESYA